MRLFCGFSATMSDFFALDDTLSILGKIIALVAIIGGVRGIRTPEAISSLTRFPVVIVGCHSKLVVNQL
jgi:hypothetical protein